MNDVVNFPIGTTVYHKTGRDPGIVTAIIFRDAGIVYEVTWKGRCIENHCAVELTVNRPDKVMAGEDE